MKLSSEEHDPHLEKLSAWLKKSTVPSRPDFLARIRQRILTESEPVDQLLDQLLEMDLSLKNPRMVSMVRRRLDTKHHSSGNKSLTWFSWLTPLAAAATLTLAFISFQSQAPQTTPVLATQQAVPTQIITPPVNDFEVTQIFALAANLHSSADMSQLQSVEDLASLFD